MENPDLAEATGDRADEATDVATRIARRTLDARGPDYPAEVRRLLDAGREVMRRCGTDARPRVADIVAEAGLSNDAFYRHFRSKEELVAAILEDGTERLRAYLAHQMAKTPSPEDSVRCWVTGVLSQAADEDIAATTRAVLWNAGSLGTPLAATSPAAYLGALLEAPLAELGSTDPTVHASLVANAVVGRLSEHLRRRAPVPAGEVDEVTAFCLAAVRG